jgi:heptosyltransferase-3
MPTLDQAKRILIFRPGSLGDTIVTLPFFHLLARRFPDAEKRVLSYSPPSPVYASLKSVLEGSGLIQGYFEVDFKRVRYKLRDQLALRRLLRSWRPDFAVYMTMPRDLPRLLSEALFFKSCGIGRIVGVPYKRSLREYRWAPEKGLFEHEAERIARCTAELGDPMLDDPASWDLRITSAERAGAESMVRSSMGGRNFLVFATGTAMEVKDWGEPNWLRFTEQMARVAGGYGLALVGAQADRARSEALRRAWPGPTLNLCGEFAPRQNAALMELATMFVGHDSGPMHLAAATGLPCVAIFSAHNKPGPWFPFGRGHRVIYHTVACSDCGLEKCEKFAKRCITSITVDEVFAAATDLLCRFEVRSRGLMRQAAGAAPE